MASKKDKTPKYLQESPEVGGSAHSSPASPLTIDKISKKKGEIEQLKWERNKEKRKMTEKLSRASRNERGRRKRERISGQISIWILVE
jgi:hypothetical protein